MSDTGRRAGSRPVGRVARGVIQVIGELNAGRLRVAERRGVGDWLVNQWIKKAVLLSFRLNDNRVMRAGGLVVKNRP